MTSLTDTQVVTASGGLVELGYLQKTSSTSITSTTAGSGTDVFGSTLTVVCDGSPVVVEFFTPYAETSSSGANTKMNVSLYYDGSEQVRYWGFHSSESNNLVVTPYHLTYRMTPTAGSHTFGVKAFSSAGTNGSIGAGNSGTSNAPMFLRVSKIVQATQWPAVTTGTIICTSSTRPASPFEGQRIYQTDDKRELVYNGSAWVTTTPVSATVGTYQTRNANSYDDLATAGPSVTLSTGTSALVTISSWIQVGANIAGYAAPAVSGASTVAASDTYMISNYVGVGGAGSEVQVASTFLLPLSTAGNNTFTMKYKSFNGTVGFARRRITVVGIP